MWSRDEAVERTTRRTWTAGGKKIGLAIGLALLAALALPGSRGLRLVVTNRTKAALTDVVVDSPGGGWLIPRIEPGGSASRTIRAPLAGLWGRSCEVPLSWTFTQEGERAESFAVRCELGWWGLREVALEASLWGGPSIHAGAKMIGTYYVDPGRFVRNTLNPSIGPRRFYNIRYHAYRKAVIRRTDWRSEVHAMAHDVAKLTFILSTNPPAGQLLLIECGFSLWDDLHRPPKPSDYYRLPMKDWPKDFKDPSADLIQSPLMP